MTTHELAIATLNLENGERIDLLPELVAEASWLDVLLLQEGRERDRRGPKRRFRAESMLAPLGLDRSFLTRSTRGTLHELVFVRSTRLRPLAPCTPDLPDVFGDQIGAVELLAGRLTAPLTVRSVHRPHWSGDARLDETLRLTRYAAPGACAVIGGDFNSLHPDCQAHAAESGPDWAQLPPYKRPRKTLPLGLRPPGTVVSGRRALTALAEAGRRSAGCVAGDMTPTVSAAADQGQGGRTDRILLSPMLASAVVPGSCQVRISGTGNQASDSPHVGAARPDPDQVPRDAGEPVTAPGSYPAAAGTRPGADPPGWLSGMRVALPGHAGKLARCVPQRCGRPGRGMGPGWPVSASWCPC